MSQMASSKNITIIVGIIMGTIALSFIFIKRIPISSYSFGEFLGLALILYLAPYGAYSYYVEKQNEILDKDLLDYLSQIESYVKSGKNLLFSLTLPKNERKKPLRKKLERLEKMLNLGFSPVEALGLIVQEMPTLLSKEAFSILQRLVIYGGDVGSVLESAREHLGDLLSIEDEKKSVMRNYGSIMYISYFILLIILIFFIKYFLFRFSSSAISSPFGAFGNPLLIKNLMLQFLIVEGAVSGIIAGKLISGKSSSGFIHSVVMIALGIIIYSVFIP